jgi:hypothetical protein
MAIPPGQCSSLSPTIDSGSDDGEFPTTEDESDAFSDISSDEEGMFDMFTGEIRQANNEDDPILENYSLDVPADEVSYRYGSLESWRNIRLLQIEPGEYDEKIQCSLRLTSVDNPSPYIALSYAWGQLHADGSHLCRTLHCGGHEIKVTQSLYSGLKMMRQHWMSGDIVVQSSQLSVWADAVCIDQQNLVERSEQVMLMAQIYGNCSRLVVWLDDSTTETDDGVVEAFTACNTQIAASNPDKTSLLQIRQYIEELDMQRRQDLADFFRKPWFTRRWVMQEVFCSERSSGFRSAPAVVLFGQHIIPLSSVVLLLKGLQGLSLPETVDAEYAHFFMSSSPSFKDPLTLMQAWDDQHCYEPRDIVYAVVEILNNGQHLVLPIDYRASVAKVYTDFAQWLLTTCSLTQLLACAISRRSTERTDPEADLVPSWVPDWRTIHAYNTHEHRSAVSTELKSAYPINDYKIFRYDCGVGFPKRRLVFEPRLFALDLNNIPDVISRCMLHHPSYGAEAYCRCALGLQSPKKGLRQSVSLHLPQRNGLELQKRPR